MTIHLLLLILAVILFLITCIPKTPGFLIPLALAFLTMSFMPWTQMHIAGH